MHATVHARAGRRVRVTIKSNRSIRPSTLNCLDFFGRTAIYGQVMEIATGVRATFIDAGHILGSASIFLELEEQSS